jgi:hypothetical protein
VGWLIEFEGEVYRDADLTLGQCEQVEEMTGRSWLVIHPLRWAKDARAILSVCVADRTKQSVDAVSNRLAAMNADEFIAMVKVDMTPEVDDRPTEYVDGFPQPADEPSTPT